MYKSNWRKKRYFLLILLISTAVIIYYYSMPLMQDQKSNYYTKYRSANNNHTKAILYWQPLFSLEDMGLGLGSKIFANCEYSNCMATNNKSLMPIEDFDAIVFHGAEYHRFYSWKFGKPAKRSPHQVYIFLSMEAPTYTHMFFTGPYNFYNWTMTYRLDSDIIRPYGYVINKNTNYTPPTVEEIEKRPNKMAWFVSNCRSPSQRHLIYDLLSRHFTIDVYGACGNFTCDISKVQQCYEMLSKNYKFYLSFENSLCVDYVTEKLYKVLKHNIVPIVYGAANYSKIAPPNSVVNVINFKSKVQLVNYIKMLDNNPKEYLKYFEWKKNYVVKTNSEKTLCDLCRKLHKQSEGTSIYDIYKWVWGDNSKYTCDNSWVDQFS